VESLLKPGRDPRSELPVPIFKQGILKIEDLSPGTELKGTVQNVVDFGAFVDVGLKDSGLVHISQLANKFIKSPYDIVSVGDIVTVWVMAVDMERKRVSLTMISPGTERRQPEQRRPFNQGERQEGGRPPFRREGQQRGDRPPQQGGDRRPFPPREGGGQRDGGGGRFGGGGGQRQGGGRFGGGQGGAGGRFGGGGGQRRQPPPRQDGESGTPASMPPPQKAPVKRKEKPKPKLTEAALAGKAPLRTFGELKALFETKKPEDAPPAVETPPVTEPPAENAGSGEATT
jgi:protein Tex